MIDDAVQAWAEIELRPHDPDELGRALLRMNAEAMRQRHPQVVHEEWWVDRARSEHQQYVEVAATYRFRKAHPDPRQRRCSCACLAYQCAEGDVPAMPLYRTLVRVRDATEARHPSSQTERRPNGLERHKALVSWDRARESWECTV